MKKIFYFIILISFSFSQQGLNLEELETSSNGVMMYPYSGKVFEYYRREVDPEKIYKKDPKNTKIL